MYRSICLALLVCVSALLIAGCSGSAAPEIIASYPKQQTPIARYPLTTQVVYQAYLDLKVYDVERSVDAAVRIAQDFSGYLVSSQSWRVDRLTYTTLVLAVPSYYFEDLRRSLLSLGELVGENVKGELVTYRDERIPPPYAEITLYLHSSQVVLPPSEPGGWNPARTFRQAFAVFVSIFGTLADVLIWVLVVAGPFALLGWLAWKAVRKSQGKGKDEGGATKPEE